MPNKTAAAVQDLSDEQILELAKNADALQRRAAEIEARKKAEAEAKARAEYQARLTRERATAKENSMSAMSAGLARMAAKRPHATGVPWFDAMDENEQLRHIATENLKAYGSVVPPIDVRLAALEKECPGCHKTKPILTAFGVRVYAGSPRAQSYCKTCRGAKPPKHGPTSR